MYCSDPSLLENTSAIRQASTAYTDCVPARLMMIAAQNLISRSAMPIRL
jgi:hypothetical protein